MSSNESAAYEIMRSLDVDYVLIIFGGVIGYSGDDINKFLWMVRIAEGEHPKDIRVSDGIETCCLRDGCFLLKKMAGIMQQPACQTIMVILKDVIRFKMKVVVSLHTHSLINRTYFWK